MSVVPAHPHADDLVKAYRSGKTIRQAATQIGVSYQKAREMLFVAGVRTRGRAIGTVLDTGRLVKAYNSGLSIGEAARRVGVGYSVAREQLLAAGVPLRGATEATLLLHRQRRGSEAAVVADLYRQGKSVKRIAAELGVARRHIVLCLQDQMLPVRNRSEAMRLRIAHEGGANVSRKMRLALGEGSSDVANELQRRRVSVERERVIGNICVDMLVAGTLAVEMHRSAPSPISARSRERQRIVDLLNAGFPVAYIWSYRHAGCGLDAGACADQIVAWLNVLGPDPATGCEYRVFRGCGQLVARGGTEVQQKPVVLPPHGRRYGTCHAGSGR